MKWEKVNNKQVAQGKFGKFVIERGSGFYWAKYYSPGKNFTLPQHRSIKELKEKCQSNHYWED